MPQRTFVSAGPALCMEYAALAEQLREIEVADGDHTKRDLLARLFLDTDDLLPEIVLLVRGRVQERWEAAELGVSSSLTRRAVVHATGVEPAELENRWKESGDLGTAAEWAVQNRRQRTLATEPLTVERVVETLQEIATYEGAGSESRRVDAVASLINDATPLGARFVVRTALGHLRIGVGEAMVRDAIATAFLTDEAPSNPEVSAIERALQVTNDFRVVARTARDDGINRLRDLDVELFRPVKSMLARKAETLEDGISDAAGDSEVLAEYKYDGVRVQIHVDHGEVRVFTRRLMEVSDQFPDVVRTVRTGMETGRAILDGELVGYEPESGNPVAFQRFSKRIKRIHDVDQLATQIPARVYLFDCLYDGESLLDHPLDARLERLTDAFNPHDDLQRASHTRATIDQAGSEAVRDLYEAALADGHEGVMLKDPTAVYEPGRRVGMMLKIKPTMEPLDLVVTRAVYSEGRRSEQLGRLYLACYDADTDRFREVGRLSTGYTDEELAALTTRLESLARERDGRNVDLDPRVVLEVEYEEIQESPEYDSGFALRFPRFLRVRQELAPEDADSHQRVRELYESQ